MKKLLAILLCLLLPASAFSETVRVYDNAGLFSDEEKDVLEEVISEYRRETRLDLAILTTDDYIGDGVQLYIADTFYDSVGLGIGSQKDGFVFYIDMANRIPCISTCGAAIEIFSEKLDRLFDVSHDSLASGEYAEAMLAMIAEATAIHNEYLAQYLGE